MECRKALCMPGWGETHCHAESDDDWNIDRRDNK